LSGSSRYRLQSLFGPQNVQQNSEYFARLVNVINALVYKNLVIHQLQKLPVVP
jgi:hypothetical protein